MPVTADEMIQAILAPMKQALDDEGITMPRLAKQLGQELEAMRVEVRGGKEGLQYSKPLVAWDVRQRARMDAHKLLGHYPAEKHDISGSIAYEHFISDELENKLKEIYGE